MRLGTGECGNYSGGNKVVAQWFPVKERALAIGIFNSASMIGSFIAPFLVIPVAERYGWRAGFLVPSTLGLVWVPNWNHETMVPYCVLERWKVSRMMGASTDSAWRSTKLMTVTEKRSARIDQRMWPRLNGYGIQL